MLRLVLDIAMFAGLLAYLHALKHHKHSKYAASYLYHTVTLATRRPYNAKLSSDLL